ncbi:hypothetical protein OEZ85_004823 [Tetradesmus obliquus]|uniref:Uncharacterized protein n=1 Tax=Tetradesmus obliquus TaxID=3088 RepID=A0ABY8UH82_TETOB|nr:hypothetical protein OEZ85_004823 [Tetradesmus obliquus]
MAKDGGKGCYWGFGTRGNRIAWGLVVLAVVLGTAFWIPGVIEVKKCINKHSACACSPIAGGGYVCLNRTVPSEAPRVTACYEQYLVCMKRPIAVWSVGWLFLAVLTWLPCCYFCCCSRSPKHAAGAAAAAPGALYGVQMAAPVAGVPPYSNGQYGYPPSYAAPQPPPTPAYPATAAGGQLLPGGSMAVPPQPSGHYNLYQQPSYDQNVPVHRY